MLLWQYNDAYYMMLPRELCEPVRKRLSMYILRAKVKAADVSAEHALFGFSGARATAMAAEFAGTTPLKMHGAVHANGVSILRLPVDRFLLVAAASKAAEIDATLTKMAAGLSDDYWFVLDIEAGIPNIVQATQEQFVPQTVNFDLIDAVSFDKGCYPGQEIVARTHFLGKVKQRMVRARLQSAEAPVAGDKLYSDTYGDQASGMIVNAVRTATGEHKVLAVIQASDIDKAAVRWKSPTGATLEIQPLPYALT